MSEHPWKELEPQDLLTHKGIIIACKPVNHGLNRTQLRQLESEAGAPYKAVGAIEIDCQLCGQLMYLGPRQQEHRSPTTVEACWICAIKSGVVTPGSLNIRHAGGI
jgi:hypothetical protein